MPFSKSVRFEINNRDLWTCRCGRAYEDGYRIDASHIDHTRNENYNNPENGFSQCQKCHLISHLALTLDETVNPDWAYKSALLLLTRSWKQGFRFEYQYLEEDRKEIIEILEQWNMVNMLDFASGIVSPNPLRSPSE